jgi:two-component system cell cycle response regulator
MCARVLVVDDDPVNLDLMIYLLEAFGHTPLPANGGALALETVLNANVDLVLCDIQMPGMDGFQFLHLLGEARAHHPPVIGVTALAMVGDREKILAAGFNGYMAKPISPETFVEEIERYLSVSQRLDHQVTLELPAVPYEAPRAAERKDMRVLVVDDEPSNLQILRLLLEHWGYDVLVAENGNAALDLARSEQPDAIISDVHMPEGDGIELVEKVRSDPSLKETPIILVSATGPRSRAVDRGIALGGSTFLVRPFEPEVLLGALTLCLTKVTR